MLYTNDETDKAIRTRNYYLLVWVIPAILVLLAGIGTWIIYTVNPPLGKQGYVVFLATGVAIASFWHQLQKRNWLKMPDGTFSNTRHLHNNKPVNIEEPATWEAEYHKSLFHRCAPIFFSILFAGMGIYLFLKSKSAEAFIIPGICIIVPLIVTFMNMGKNGPLLKLAHSGIWTRKLGFVKWEKVRETRIIEEKSNDHNNTNLEIYLHDTMHAQAGKPDDVVRISVLADYKNIELLIGHLKPVKADITDDIEMSA